MNCPYCDEAIEPSDVVMRDAVYTYHRECMIRLVAGSAAHQLGECSCHGGTRDDPPGLSLRDAARLACDAFDALRAGVTA